MRELINKLSLKKLTIILLTIHAVVFFLVNLKINIFRYNNFDYGKFDLGNMTQMVWNVLHGNGLTLTDYFGTNLPRYAMSHVDPILYLFVPIFAIFPHPLTLVISQLLLLTLSCYIIYLLADLKLQSKVAALFIASAFLFYPALGFLAAWTGFHGVSAAVVFFLLAFYMFEYMYTYHSFTKKNLIIFWLSVVVALTGKEQISAYIFLFGLFIVLFRHMSRKLGYTLMTVGLVWLVTAFFIIIPSYAHYRIEGYENFASKMGISNANTRDVSLPNYFLSRYAEFGDSYIEILFNVLIRPAATIEIFFGGDKVENFTQTLAPVLYLPLLNPFTFVLSAPDFLANYLTTEGGIGTAEIYNHRISMIIPVVFISTIYAILYIRDWYFVYENRLRFSAKNLSLLLCTLVLFGNIYTSCKYNNPVYLWVSQAIQKRLPIVFAKSENTEEIFNEKLLVGKSIRTSPLEDKDRECSQKIVDMIPADASVSGPDYLGAHLSMRKTYAIFPALYDEADYVIVDVFSQKIVRILDVDLTLVKDVTKDLIIDADYKQIAACGNLFVFQNVGVHSKSKLLPLQERRQYTPKYDYEILRAVKVVDYNIPTEVQKGKTYDVTYVYTKEKNEGVSDFVLFTTLINKETGEVYQVANLPSFSFIRPSEWLKGYFYTENIELVVPEFMDAGDYGLFVGMTNRINTRSVYLGDIKVN